MKRVIILLLILLVPYASALSIDEFQFLSHGSPITAVSNGKVPNIVLKIVVSGEGFTSLKADISSLNSNEAVVSYNNYANKVVGVSECDFAEEAYTCYIRDIELRLSEATVTIPVTLYTDSASETIDKTFTFTIDSTKPEITFIGTENCIEDTCYFASGKYNEIVMIFQDSQATFEKKLVRFSLAGKKHFIYKCDGMTCHGRARETCVSGQKLPLKILPLQTMDDAYNRISNSMRNDVLCDGQTPVEKELNLTTNTFDIIRSDSEIKVVIALEEDLGPTLNARANFSGIGVNDLVEGVCEKKDDYVCTFTADVVRQGPYEDELIFYISDFAGNVLEITEPIEVFSVIDQEMDLWRVRSTESSPKKAPVREMLINEWQVYQYIDFSSNSGNPEIIHISVESCQGENDDSVVSLGTDIISYSKKALITYTFPKTSYSGDKLEFNCTLAIYSKKGQSVTRNPEREVVDLKLELFDAAGSAEKVEDEIVRLQEKIEEKQKQYDKFYNIIGKVYGMANWLCTMPGAFYSVASSLGLVQGALGKSSYAAAAVPGGQPAAAALYAEAEIVKKTSEASSLTGDAALKFTTTACQFLTCNPPFLNKLNDEILSKIPLHDKIDDYAQSMNFENSVSILDPYKSEYVAYLKLCPPAVLFHEMRKTSIECHYLNCIETNLQTGMPLSICKEQKNYEQCAYSTGSLFHTFPIAAAINDFGTLLKNIASDPVSVVLSLSTYFGCKADVEIVSHSVCTVTKSIININKLISLVANFRGPVSAMNDFPGSVEAQMCADIVQKSKNLEYITNIGGFRVAGTGVYCDNTGCKYQNYRLRYDEVFTRKDYFVKTEKGEIALTPNEDVPGTYTDKDGNEYSTTGAEIYFIERSIIDIPDYIGAELEMDFDAVWKKKIKEDFKNMGVSNKVYDSYIENKEKLSNIAEQERDLYRLQQEIIDDPKLTNALESINEEIKKTKIERNDIEKDLKKDEKKIAEESQYGQGFLDGIVGMANTFRLFHSVASSFGLVNYEKPWLRINLWILGDIYDNKLQIDVVVEDYCSRKEFDGSGGEFALGKDYYFTYPAAFITGTKTTVDTPDGMTYRYYVYGQISNAKKDNLKFDIYLKGSSGKHIINESIELDKGESFPVSNPSAMPFFKNNLTKNYDKACIEFNVDHLNMYFDVVGFDGNTMCTSLVKLR